MPSPLLGLLADFISFIQCVHRFSSFGLEVLWKMVLILRIFPGTVSYGVFGFVFFFLLMGVVIGIWIDTLILQGKKIYEADDLMTCTV